MIIPTAENVKTVTDLRENIINILAAVNKREGPTYIFHHSRPRAILLSIEEYIKLQELLEDYSDAIEAMELEKNPEKGGQSLEEVAHELGITLPSRKGKS